MKSGRMKRILLSVIAFLFVGCSIAGGTVLLSNSSISDSNRGGDSTPSENELTKNAPTNTSGTWTWSGRYADSFAGGTGTEDDPYLIETEAQLARLSYLVNSSSYRSQYRAKSYKQIADIDLSAYYWTPIGDYDSNSNNYFAGNYDGGGYNISGLFIDDSNAYYQGFFGWIECVSDSDEIYIKNISITNSVVDGSKYVGAIAGYASSTGYCHIENCYSEADVFGFDRVGGICGRGNSIRYCVNRGEINADYSDARCGGITASGSPSHCFNFGNVVATNRTSASRSNVGGITPYTLGTIKNCYNAGNISGYYAGGIVGQYFNAGEISECWNTGHVESIYGKAGGIVGYLYYGSGSIKNCYNAGNISGYYAGGIVGENIVTGESISYCYNLGQVSSNYRAAGICAYQKNEGQYGDNEIYNCFNFGQADDAGIVRYMDPWAQNVHGTAGNTYLYNSYVYESLDIPIVYTTSRGEVIDCGTCTEEQAKSVEWYTNRDNWYSGAWDFDNVWTIVPGVNDGFPILRNMASFITYVSNFGENETVTQNSPAGESVVIAGVDLFEREGYTISSWNTMADGSGDSFAPGFTFEGGVSLTLYAQWGRMAYTVTFDANGGSGTMSSVEKNYNEDLVLPANEFTKTGYNFKGWVTSANGSVVYGDGAKYTVNVSATLYAVWEAKIIQVNLDENGGSGGTSTIYLKYDSGWYSSSSCTSSSKITALPSTPTRTGYEFKGYSTESDGSGTLAVSATGAINVSDTFYSTDGARTWYAVWEARNPAYYDSEGGFWYVENGKLPQSKVGESLKATLSGQWSSLSDGSVYYMGVEELANSEFTSDGGMQSKVYNGEEYVKFNGEYYLVEPIRWRLVYSSSQQEGYAVENTSVLATMAEIVFVGSYSSTKIGVGAGYSAESVTMLLKNQVSDEYLFSESREVNIFGTTTPKDTTTVSGNVFVASMEELANFKANKNNTTGSGVKVGKVSLSDFVKDYLRATGQGNYYFTRDLGDQLNTIRCLNPVGDRSQAKAQQTLGVQFTIKVTEYACKSV